MITPFETLEYRLALSGDSNHDGSVDNLDLQAALCHQATALASRPGDVSYELAPQPLTVGGFDYNDIHQGQIGDCYFLAALAETTHKHPEIIDRLFTDNFDGTWQVNFAAGTVTVDAALPPSAAGHTSELWVALAEKAYAELQPLYGKPDAYASIEGGFPGPAMQQITGHDYWPLDGKDTLAGFNERYNAWAMICASFGTHSYAVTGWDNPTQTATLYDPYGSSFTMGWADLQNTLIECVR